MGALYSDREHTSKLILPPKGGSRRREEVLLKEFIPTPEAACFRGTLQHTTIATAQYLDYVSEIYNFLGKCEGSWYTDISQSGTTQSA
jgi:hypothetical protein